MRSDRWAYEVGMILAYITVLPIVLWRGLFVQPVVAWKQMRANMHAVILLDTAIKKKISEKTGSALIAAGISQTTYGPPKTVI